MKVPDLNVLLYAVNADAPQHAAAVAWWNSALSGPETVGLSWAVLMGFVRMSTRPAAFPRPLTSGNALDRIDRWLARKNTTLIEPTARHTAVLRDLLAHTGVGGNLVSDAHLAALAIEHGAELVSADHDFGRFPGLRWVNPLA